MQNIMNVQVPNKISTVVDKMKNEVADGVQVPNKISTVVDVEAELKTSCLGTE